ncbi:MAG TPA: hypothetical protein VK827_05765, partial [Lysobacter sp.]|nr:hypothetical protein [Lysobacter sp.]
GDLGTTIRSALVDSEWLILICSPTAAKSHWVNAEVEAFLASGRGDRVLCFVVGGAPGSTDPDQQCFPPALLQPDAGGVLREPLAADARPSGDGRERAFLKLVAGLLGVGYDALAQREAQRRARRLTAIASASLLGMTIALGLAFTAYLARNEAVVARNDAQRRQAQAEDILGFMLGDLREKLTTVGRLDLMGAVDAKAMTYFAALDPRDLSDRTLEEQARALTGMGQVRLDEGDHDAAMSAFREAHARSTALRERAPGNGQRLYDLAQAEYWIGAVALQQGRLDDTETWFRRYRDSAIELAAMDRANFDWQREMVYGHQNLAVLDESRGRYAAAEQAMVAQLELYRIWTAQRPQDLALRFDAANIASWLGSLAMRQGRLAEAEAYFTEQVAAIRQNVVDDPDNAKWQENSIDAMVLLADAQAQRGRVPDAQANVDIAASIAAALLDQDPANNGWRLALAGCRLWQAELAPARDPTAELRAAEAATLVARAHAAEPQSEWAMRFVVRAHNVQARLALLRGDAAATRDHLTAAKALIEPAWRAQQNEALRLWLARTRLLQADVAQRDGHAAAATSAWGEVRQLLLDDATGEIPFDRLDPLIRALDSLGQSSEAMPLRQRLEAAGYVPRQPFATVRSVR